MRPYIVSVAVNVHRENMNRKEPFVASKKELKPLKAHAESQGWKVNTTRNGRLKWESPKGGLPYFSSSTPSDRRAIHNIVGDLRRRGYVPAKG